MMETLWGTADRESMNSSPEVMDVDVGNILLLKTCSSTLDPVDE